MTHKIDGTNIPRKKIEYILETKPRSRRRWYHNLEAALLVVYMAFLLYALFGLIRNCFQDAVPVLLGMVGGSAIIMLLIWIFKLIAYGNTTKDKKRN